MGPVTISLNFKLNRYLSSKTFVAMFLFYFILFIAF